MHGKVAVSIYPDLGLYLRCFRWILHDPEIYPDPDEFKPERFLNNDGSFRDDPTIALAFGVGKRICPGRHVVDATLFIVASSVLSVFNITKAKDENGREIPVRAAMTARTGLILYVRVFAHKWFSKLTDGLQDIRKCFSVLFLRGIKLQNI
jgi:hypothetical protein